MTTNPWTLGDHDPLSHDAAAEPVIVRITYAKMRFENTTTAQAAATTLARMYAEHSIIPTKRSALRGTCTLTGHRVQAAIIAAGPTAACHWNGCTRPGRAQYNGRCAHHEWSQCRTTSCPGDAEGLASGNGYCPACYALTA